MLIIPCIFLYLIRQPTNALNKIPCVTSINLLRVSALACHPQVVFRIKEIQDQPANLGMHCTHWNDHNIKIVKYIQLFYILYFVDRAS
jgi:hypothetical protein